MNQRRTRVHHSGASNLDFRTKDGKLDRPFGVTTLDFLATAKPKDKSEVFKPRLLRTAEDPLGKTKAFYAEKGKEFKQKMDITAPRFGHLEELEKRKPVFNGDSNMVYETKRTAQFGAGPRFTDGYQSDHPRPKKSGQSTKLDENSAALQETQLVGLDKFRSETLEGKVSLEKVREVKRAIRRRYANRKNLQKIFNLWDEENKGTISIPNVVNMVNRLGMNVNFDEARVLVASTNRDGTNQIKMDEFLDLIYNTNDTMNVNLASLPPLTSELLVQKSQLDEGDPNFFKQLNQDADQARRVRHNNQLYFILKNRTNELAQHFLKEDQFQSGYVNFPKFEQGMRKLGINEQILSDRDIKEMYEKFNVGEHKFDYKDYLHNLKEFQFNPDNVYKAQYEGIAKETFDMEAAEQILFGKSDDKKIHILDVQKQHQSQVEKIFARAQRVNRAIHRYFPNKKDFQDFIAKQMNVEENDAENKTVHQKQLHGVISSLFANFDDKLSNKDFEGFLSSITYNAHGEARIADVAKTLYDEDDTTYMVRIQKREHGPPPGLTADAKAENGETVKRDYLSTFFVSTQFPNQDDPKLGDILRRVEQKVFLGKTRAFDAFKQFDTDHDGYVSTQDVKKKLSEMCILNPKEEDVFIQYLDPQGKGHVNFTEFSARVKQNMTWNNKDGVNTVVPSVFTSKEVHDQNVAMLPDIPKKKAEVKKSYSPDSYVMTRTTRYGASPAYKDTFVSFQPDARSPMYTNEADRFRRDPNASVKFQQDAKEKKAAVHAAKLANIRSHHEQFRQKIDDATIRQDLKEEGKLREKGLRQSTYEQRLHLMGASG